MVVDELHICKGCNYSFYCEGCWCCEYYIITGSRRPCKGGAGCIVREGQPELKLRHSSSRNWGAKKILELCRQGKSTAEIAQEVEVSKSTVLKCLNQHGLMARNVRQDRRPEWDTEKAMELYRQGKTTSEIAQVVGASKVTVYRWFYKRGYFANMKHKQGHREDGGTI